MTKIINIYNIKCFKDETKIHNNCISSEENCISRIVYHWDSTEDAICLSGDDLGGKCERQAWVAMDLFSKSGKMYLLLNSV